jgi:hypothetical protein
MKIPNKEKDPLDIFSVFPQIDEITDVTLRMAVVSTWEALWKGSRWNKMDDVPTSLEIPYPTVPHNRCVLDISIAIADAFERHHGIKLNRDYLIAAAVLQDASKVNEFAPDADGNAIPTELGKNFPHAFWAAHVALQHGVPDEVVHVLLTHTPQSPKFPNTLEGKILYYVDQIDVIGIHKDRWKKEIFISK